MFVDKVVYHVSPHDNLTGPRPGGGDYGTAFYTSDNEEGSLYYARARTEKGLPDLISLNGQWIDSNLLEDYFLKSQGILDENTSIRDKKCMPFIHALLHALKKRGGEATFSRAELEEILANKDLLWNNAWQTNNKLREAFFKKFENVPLKTKPADKPNTSLYEVAIKGNFLQILTLDMKKLTLADNGYHDLDTKKLYEILKLDYPDKKLYQVIEKAHYIAFSLGLSYHYNKDKILNPLTDQELKTFKKEAAFIDRAIEHYNNMLTDKNYNSTTDNLFDLMSDPTQNNMELGYRTFDLERMNKLAEAETEKTLQVAERLMKYALLNLPIQEMREHKGFYNLGALHFDGLIDPGITKNTYYYVVHNLNTLEFKRIKNEKTNWEWQKVKKTPNKSYDKRIFDALCGDGR